jgi:hypothetical protein
VCDSTQVSCSHSGACNCLSYEKKREVIMLLDQAVDALRVNENEIAERILIRIMHLVG